MIYAGFTLPYLVAKTNSEAEKSVRNDPHSNPLTAGILAGSTQTLDARNQEPQGTRRM
ncbi:MFS domain-containing protein [Psidium guajava]|nr:MFS domain-containing protein [Psidium guajava]